jgi:hypothetical protein
MDTETSICSCRDAARTGSDKIAALDVLRQNRRMESFFLHLDDITVRELPRVSAVYFDYLADCVSSD